MRRGLVTFDNLHLRRQGALKNCMSISYTQHCAGLGWRRVNDKRSMAGAQRSSGRAVYRVTLWRRQLHLTFLEAQNKKGLKWLEVFFLPLPFPPLSFLEG